MRVGVLERRVPPLRVEPEQQCTRLRLFLRCGRVVEDADEPVSVLTHVVLPLEPRAGAEREVAALAAESPENPARAPAHFVGGPRVPGRDEQVSVWGHVDRVDMEVVEAGPRSLLDLGLVDGDVLEAAPLPDQAAARKRQLLDDAPDDLSTSAASDARQIPRHGLVARHERGVVRSDDEFVQVAVAAVRRGKARELAVRRVENDPLPVPEAVHDLALPPCQHRLPAIPPDLEVGHGLVGDRTEPDELAGVVEDHRTALPRP